MPIIKTRILTRLIIWVWWIHHIRWYSSTRSCTQAFPTPTMTTTKTDAVRMIVPAVYFDCIHSSLKRSMAPWECEYLWDLTTVYLQINYLLSATIIYFNMICTCEGCAMFHVMLTVPIISPGTAAYRTVAWSCSSNTTGCFYSDNTSSSFGKFHSSLMPQNDKNWNAPVTLVRIF